MSAETRARRTWSSGVPTAFARERSTRKLVAVALGIVLVVGAVFAVLRWSGQLPWGSDNDEYLLVARELASFEGPSILGVEGTKYPLGYPMLLAILQWLRLPVAPTALVVNALAILATAVLAGGLAARIPEGRDRLARATAALLAGGYVAVNAALWGSAYSVMPDVLLALVTVAILLVATHTTGRRDVAVLTLQVVLATALKSVGLLIGLGAAAGLFLVRDLRRISWWPVAGAVVVTGGMSLAVAGYPEHTTGYARTFWLANPYDASQGEVGVLGVLGRLVGTADVYARDVGAALVGPHAGRGLRMALAGLLVLLGLVALRRAGRTSTGLLIGAGVVVAYSLGLLIWPFSSLRFGFPLIPLGALAAGLVGAGLGSLRIPGTVLAVVALAAFGTWSAQQVTAEAAEDAAELAALHEATDELEAWVEGNVAAEAELASMDYREIGRHLDRQVLPVAYTTDPETLWEQTGGAGAEYLVVTRELYPRRETVADTLLRAYPDRFSRVYANARVEVFAIDGAGGA